MSCLIDSQADDLSAGLSEMMQTRSGAVLRMRDLLELAGLALPAEGKLAPATNEQLSRVLDRLGIALEPDYRYDGWSPTLDDKVVVFKAECGGPINSGRTVYRETKIKIDALALSAAVQKSLPNKKFELVKNEIAMAPEFSNIERARLLAYAFASLASSPKLMPKKRSARGDAGLSALLDKNIFPLAAAILLFGSAVLLNHFAMLIDHSQSMTKMSAADVRHECSLITDDSFRADCLHQAQQAE
jgi:hypothetical protein